MSKTTPWPSPELKAKLDRAVSGIEPAPPSTRTLIALLAQHLERGTDHEAVYLHQHLGPMLARILDGEKVADVLKPEPLGKRSTATMSFHNSVAGFVEWRRSQGATEKAAVLDVVELLGISDSDVRNAMRADHDIGFEGVGFAYWAQLRGLTPEKALQVAHSAHVAALSNAAVAKKGAKKAAKKKPRK